MNKPDFIDAEFVVVRAPHGAEPVQWQPRRRVPAGLSVVRWAFFSLIMLAAGCTALVGLSGGDIDTRPEPRPAPVLSDDVLAVPPVR